jgi:hypothetical protein
MKKLFTLLILLSITFIYSASFEILSRIKENPKHLGFQMLDDEFKYDNNGKLCAMLIVHCGVKDVLFSNTASKVAQIDKQSEYYKSQNFPENYGLYAMGNFIKKISPKMTILELKWWEHITKYSSRDQCSFMYCVWDMEKNKTPIDILTLNGDLGQNKYFRSRNQYRLK